MVVQRISAVRRSALGAPVRSNRGVPQLRTPTCCQRITGYPRRNKMEAAQGKIREGEVTPSAPVKGAYPLLSHKVKSPCKASERACYGTIFSHSCFSTQRGCTPSLVPHLSGGNRCSESTSASSSIQPRNSLGLVFQGALTYVRTPSAGFAIWWLQSFI